MQKKSLVSYRWGDKRPPSSLVRISAATRLILDRVPEVHRRQFVDDAIYSASLLPVYDRLCNLSKAVETAYPERKEKRIVKRRNK